MANSEHAQKFKLQFNIRMERNGKPNVDFNFPINEIRK